MEIKQRKLSEIKPYGKNAKKHPAKQVQQIADSIMEFGFNQPLVVDKDDVLIVGHGRYFAAELLKLDEVPVLTLNIPEEKAKAYRLADNKLNESTWDMGLVISELKGLSMEMIDLTGFNRSLVLNQDEKDDAVPALPDSARTKLGDLYEIGSHKVLCGDSTQQGDFAKLLGTLKVDMIFTDPPYNVNYHGHGETTDTGILNDKMGQAQFRDFLTAAFKQMRDSIKAGGGLYIFHSSSSQIIFEEAMGANGIEVKNQLIWNKPVASMGWGDYRWKHEPFFYAGVKGVALNFYGDRTNTTVLDFHKSDAQILAWAKHQRLAEASGKTTLWSMKREPLKEYVHPTQKPVELIMYALANSSKVEDVILDPFLGSGSTLIACQKTNRSCYGVELDPKFCDVIIQRWVDYTENRQIKLNGEPLLW